MARSLARSLAREGHEVAVWNRTRARADEAAGDGVTAHDSVGEAVGLMLEAASGSGLPYDLLQTVQAVYDRAGQRGHGGDDMAAVRTAFDA
jgi:3-hydroxyisobutyrate dehydrogenase-like beta-hydroxyacid dehydrogenase